MRLNLKLPQDLEAEPHFIEHVGLMAKELYGENDAAHGFDHALRVTRLALALGEQEGADLELLVLAGLLHDVARREQELTGVCHATRGAEIAGDLLAELGYDPDRVKLIRRIIQCHRFRNQDEGQTPTSLEEKVLYDADKIDAIGAIGIGRAYAICGRRNQRLYISPEEMVIDEASGNYSPVTEYHFKLKKIVDKMLTPSGRELAERRHRFMREFFSQLQGEVEGQF